ncbi:hypothetical protein ACIHDR_48705 [Nocardia sp. NPDC052278]|uniref:hypothetical protein n=1 Tax=unclassified Nocardia TaxID=2637762 RepID=UPI0036B853BC
MGNPDLSAAATCREHHGHVNVMGGEDNSIKSSTPPIGCLTLFPFGSLQFATTTSERHTTPSFALERNRGLPTKCHVSPWHRRRCGAIATCYAKSEMTCVISDPVGGMLIYQ